MARYLHVSAVSSSNSAVTVTVSWQQIFSNTSKLCTLPWWEFAVSMQEEQAVPLRVLPPKIHLFGPSWLRTEDLQIPVRR